MRAITFSLSILAVCFASIATAQSTNWYYEQTTRYGTFRHYENGSKLVLTMRGQRDYASEIAAAQEEGRRMTEERQRQRQVELERMRKAQYATSQPSNTTRNPPPTTYNPSPEEIARRKKEKEDALYKDYEQRLEKAEDLWSQQFLMRQMYHLRPKDETALRLIASYTQDDGGVAAIDQVWERLSEASQAAHRETVYAAMASASFREGSYKAALHRLDQLKTHDQNSFTESLNCRLRLSRWDELTASLAKDIVAFPELSPIAEHLAAAATALQAGVTDTSRTSATAAALYQFALARRGKHLMDGANLVALEAAVRLVPENATYREERFNSNAVLRFKKAMEEDYQFFNK